MFTTAEKKERLILIAVEEVEGQANLDELAMLVDTSGAEAIGRIVQRREAKHARHYLGKGKVEEVAALVRETDADGVVADDELSPAQQRNLQNLLGVTVLDRTTVILDIFAQRAMSAEGKAQVELAQQKYRLSRLSGLGLGLKLSRQGGMSGHGGVGTRGPGEKKLETDRRHVRSRIQQLTQELAEIRENREVLRSKRVKSGLPVIALVGYTNAGKSTLLNTLTQAGVLAENRLFATLDTITRKAVIPGIADTEVLFTDTVGFIHKLPHHLIEAFRATLEELKYADILLHVVDLSAPHYIEQMAVVYDTLRKLECVDKPIITAYNKCDVSNTGDELPHFDTYANFSLKIAASNGTNIDNLLAGIGKVVQTLRTPLQVCIPYTEGHWINKIHSTCEVFSIEHVEAGTVVKAYAPAEIAGQLAKFATPV